MFESFLNYLKNDIGRKQFYEEVNLNKERLLLSYKDAIKLKYDVMSSKLYGLSKNKQAEIDIALNNLILEKKEFTCKDCGETFNLVKTITTRLSYNSLYDVLAIVDGHDVLCPRCGYNEHFSEVSTNDVLIEAGVTYLLRNSIVGATLDSYKIVKSNLEVTLHKDITKGDKFVELLYIKDEPSSEEIAFLITIEQFEILIDEIKKT